MSIGARRLSRHAASEDSVIFPTWTPGVYYIWGNNTDVFSMDYVRGGQVVLDWRQIEPSRGTFDWALADSRIRNYADRGMPVVIQLNSSTKPAWLYTTSGGAIHKCGVWRDPRFEWDIPHYWGTNSALYLTIMQEMLEAVADHIAGSPYKNMVLGIRAAPNLIGTEQFDLNDSSVNITNASCNYATTWTFALAKKMYEDVMRLYNPIFVPKGVRPILRSKLFVDLNTSTTLRNELLGMNKGWVFGTNGTPDAGWGKVDEFYHSVCVSGQTRGFYEAFRENSYYTHPLSWAYWRQLLELGRGVSYIATYSEDLIEALPGKPQQAEYRAAFDFSNKYAGTQHLPDQAPGAFIAFRPKYSSSDNYSNYDSLITLRNADGTLGGDASTVGLTSNSGANIIGPTNQRFGRYARRTDLANGKSTFYLRLDSTFRSSLTAAVTVRTTYLNTGTSSWTLRWSGGSKTITKTNTNRWLTDVTTVPLAGLTGTLAANSDLHLVASSSDTTFHMVEVQR